VSIKEATTLLKARRAGCACRGMIAAFILTGQQLLGVQAWARQNDLTQVSIENLMDIGSDEYS
jgi:hypothetical protein